MKTVGLMLLVSGWLLVVCAIALLVAGTARNVFAAAGLAVELLGLVLVFRSHLPDRPERG